MLRFSIRDLLWLILVVAVGLAWFVREQELSAIAADAHFRAARAELETVAAHKQAERWRAKAKTLEDVIVNAYYPPVRSQSTQE